AQLVRQHAKEFVCRMPGVRSFWQRCFGSESGMELHVTLHPLGDNAQMVEAVIRIQPYGTVNANLEKEITEIGPAIIETVRMYLQAEPDQRGRERWPCQQAVQVYPIDADLQVGQPIDGTGVNLSIVGVGMRLRQPVPTEYAYVTFPAPPVLAAAVLMRIARCKPGADGLHEVGAEFPPERPPSSSGGKPQ